MKMGIYSDIPGLARNLVERIYPHPTFPLKQEGDTRPGLLTAGMTTFRGNDE